MAEQAPRERRIRSRDGFTLAALDWAGDASRTPLLCLSGIGRNALDFAGLAERHAGQRRVVALDYIGHGESDRAAEVTRYDPREALADVLDVCAALGMPRVVTVGTSFGGLLSMFLALQRPAMLRGVVLNDIGPRIESGGVGRVREFLGRDPAFASEAEAAQYLRRVQPQLPVADEAGWLRLAARTYKRGPDGRLHPRWDLRIARAMDTGAAVSDFGPLFSGLHDIPVLLVWGELSEILSAATVNRMRGEKPDLELVVHPTSGHAPLLEEPEIAPRLDAFLDQLA